MPLTIVWVVPGDLYHQAKAAFKASRESNGFRSVSKWNDPSFTWITKNLTLTGEYERATVEGEERTVKATITLKGRNEAHALRLKAEWDQLFGVEGKEPQSTESNPLWEPGGALWAFVATARGAIERWARPSAMGDRLSPSVLVAFQRRERAYWRDQWTERLESLKAKNIDISKLRLPAFLTDKGDGKDEGPGS